MSEIFLFIVFWLVLILTGLKLFKYIRNKSKRNCQLDLHKKYLEHLRNQLDSSLNTPRPPNVIIILTDDLGYADISTYGATAISTPNIDKLAREGVSLQNFYSASPLCSPSRAGLLTGRYPLRMHISTVFFPYRSLQDLFLRISGKYRYGVDGIMEDEITLAETLQARGYSTGLLGKWHLGDRSPHLPNDKGFDFFYGSYYSNDMQPYAFYRNREIELKAPVDQTQITKSLTSEAINFIKLNADHPFFLHFCQPFPHNPAHASSKFLGSSKAGIYGDCIQEIDWSVGEIINKLDQLDIRKDTIIIFTSDNGPWYEGNPGYVRGRKGLVFEGGQRVPCIWSWPGHIPKNEKRTVSTSNLDIFPTILKRLNIPLPDDRIIDGNDIWPLLNGEEQGNLLSSNTINNRFFYCWDTKVLAVQESPWKYHRRHMNDNASYWPLQMGPLLFNLNDDPNESYNQIQTHPEEAVKLKNALEQLQKELDINPRGWKNYGNGKSK